MSFLASNGPGIQKARVVAREEIKEAAFFLSLALSHLQRGIAETSAAEKGINTGAAEQLALQRRGGWS